MHKIVRSQNAGDRDTPFFAYSFARKAVTIEAGE
jgi:hypothetical protein